MNYVNVIGSTKMKRNLVESAVIFCISELMPRMRTLEIEINLKTSRVRVLLVGVTKVRIIGISMLTLIKISRVESC